MSTSKPTPRPVRVLQMCAVDFTVRQFLVPLVERLQRDGYQVSVACSRGPHFEELIARGIDMRENPVARSGNVFRHARSLWNTYRLLRRERFDVIHVHTPVAALIGRLAARLGGVPVKIYTAHGFYFHDQMSGLARNAHIWLEKFGAVCGDYILTVSDEDRSTAIKLGIAKPDRIETILNGIDTRHFDPDRFSSDEQPKVRTQWGIPPHAPVAGMVGRLVREKGFFEFFEAAARVIQKFPEARFLVVGDVLPSDYDANRDAMRARIEGLGLKERIIFTGLIQDTAPALSIMDVFCLPSYREGMPVSLLEAMAMGSACVATDIRGCREEIVDGESGYLIPTKESQPLADRICDFFGSPDLARRMGYAARQRVLDHFDIDKILDHQSAIYERLTRDLRTGR
ncbi:glycosyltransferase family 1 protein [candidate division BRC1 bacterium HGW-BRC1-1]|jgi:glycosyltransferase involved in cell wall biosynthesis|nr:MAG: glycosyltransferase family 1 protein [candidate division BRC1 bacterium HGW-BRC1-1]